MGALNTKSTYDNHDDAIANRYIDHVIDGLVECPGYRDGDDRRFTTHLGFGLNIIQSLDHVRKGSESIIRQNFDAENVRIWGQADSPAAHGASNVRAMAIHVVVHR